MTRPSSRRTLTAAVTVVLLLVLVVVGSTVQVPFVALGPGPTVNTLGTTPRADSEVPVVEIGGATLDPVAGHLNLTTVSVSDGLTLFQAMGLWLSGTYSVQPRETQFPSDQTTDQTRQQNLRQMRDSESTATAAALSYLHRPTQLVAAEVAEDGPAASVLNVGDVIVSVDGRPVTPTSVALQQAVRAHQPGDRIVFGIRRGGQERSVTVTAQPRPGDAGVAYVGVTPEVRNADPELTISYHVFDDQGHDIGGPSAGLMLSLAIVDRLSPGELTHGRFVAGTGTVADDGVVGPIGGITHKTRAARDAGASVFLVPADNCAEAGTAVPDGLQLVKVTSLTSAIDALNALGAGRPVTGCS
ncbi:MAG: PDZ domain-containing protein [Gordonia sp. (in: high G+C Gram-positive bacteria)]